MGIKINSCPNMLFEVPRLKIQGLSGRFLQEENTTFSIHSSKSLPFKSTIKVDFSLIKVTMIYDQSIYEWVHFRGPRYIYKINAHW